MTQPKFSRGRCSLQPESFKKNLNLRLFLSLNITKISIVNFGWILTGTKLFHWLLRSKKFTRHAIVIKEFIHHCSRNKHTELSIKVKYPQLKKRRNDLIGGLTDFQRYSALSSNRKYSNPTTVFSSLRRQEAPCIGV